MNKFGSDETITYALLKILDGQPELTQRELSSCLSVSLGKVNFCVKELVAKGCLKIKRFRNSDNKMAYLYLLTPQGIEARARMTVNFLNYKVSEYERLKEEITQLQVEADELGLCTNSSLEEESVDNKGLL